MQITFSRQLRRPRSAFLSCDVAIAVGEPGRLSIRSRLRTTVRANADGAPPVDEVTLDAGGETLIASVTREAVRALDLKVGQPVIALIKATAMDRLDEEA